MTQPYQEVRSTVDGSLSCIFRISDSAHIPLDPANNDYAAYLTWVAAGNAPDADPNYLPDAIKDRKWAELKNQRDTRTAGGVKIDPYWYHTDANSRIQWIGIKDTARDMIASGGKMTDVVQMQGQNLAWKTLSGEFVTVTAQLAFDVVQATKVLDAVMFATCEAKRQALYTSTTPGTFDTSTGWQQTYAEANPS